MPCRSAFRMRRSATSGPAGRRPRHAGAARRSADVAGRHDGPAQPAADRRAPAARHHEPAPTQVPGVQQHRSRRRRGRAGSGTPSRLERRVAAGVGGPAGRGCSRARTPRRRRDQQHQPRAPPARAATRLTRRAPPSSGRRRPAAPRRPGRPPARPGRRWGRRRGRCRTAAAGRPTEPPWAPRPGARIGPPRPSRSTSSSRRVAPTTTPKEPVVGPQRLATSRTAATSGSGSPTTQPGVFQPRTVSTTTWATDRSPTSACWKRAGVRVRRAGEDEQPAAGAAGRCRTAGCSDPGPR